MKRKGDISQGNKIPVLILNYRIKLEIKSYLDLVVRFQKVVDRTNALKHSFKSTDKFHFNTLTTVFNQIEHVILIEKTNREKNRNKQKQKQNMLQ